jgi:hypothetical protein
MVVILRDLYTVFWVETPRSFPYTQMPSCYFEMPLMRFHGDKPSELAGSPEMCIGSGAPRRRNLASCNLMGREGKQQRTVRGELKDPDST